jgi:hypothetical protein
MLDLLFSEDKFYFWNKTEKSLTLTSNLRLSKKGYNFDDCNAEKIVLGEDTFLVFGKDRKDVVAYIKRQQAVKKLSNGNEFKFEYNGWNSTVYEFQGIFMRTVILTGIHIIQENRVFQEVFENRFEIHKNMIKTNKFNYICPDGIFEWRALGSKLREFNVTFAVSSWYCINDNCLYFQAVGNGQFIIKYDGIKMVRCDEVSIATIKRNSSFVKLE